MSVSDELMLAKREVSGLKSELESLRSERESLKEKAELDKREALEKSVDDGYLCVESLVCDRCRSACLQLHEDSTQRMKETMATEKQSLVKEYSERLNRLQ